MSLAYLGAANTFIETSNSGLDWDAFGMDTLTRTYEGPPSKLAPFLRAWPVNKEDAVFPWLYLVARPAPKLSPVVEISLRFTGTLERNPKTKVEGSVRLQPLQLKRAAGLLQGEYYGPVTTWHYIVVGEHPRAPRFKGQLLQTDFDYEIVNMRGTGNIRIGNSQTGNTNTNVLGGVYDYFVQARVVTSRFDFEQVGNCWQVTEENEGRLESPPLIPGVGRR